MTPEILEWLELVAKPFLLPSAGRVLEVGAMNINGSPRPLIEPIATEYIGTDMREGEGVDVIVNNSGLLKWAMQGASMDKEWRFDTLICCECLEHDIQFWMTILQLRELLKPGGHVIITTPTFGFPLHRYPKDYWRFGEDTYREVFFADMDILDLRLLDNAPLGKEVTIAGIARKR